MYVALHFSFVKLPPSYSSENIGDIDRKTFSHKTKENIARQIFLKKPNISYPLIRTRTSSYQGVRNARFSENLACFVFLLLPF